jgi:hypothetical protein
VNAAIVLKLKVMLLYIEKSLMQRNKVSEITLDMAANMSLITKKCFLTQLVSQIDLDAQKLALKHYKR